MEKTVNRTRSLLSPVTTEPVFRIRLPRLVGAREAAHALLADAPSDLSETHVLLYTHDLVTASPSFADELITELDARGATRVLVVAEHGELLEHFQTSRSTRGLTIRVQIADPFRD